MNNVLRYSSINNLFVSKYQIYLPSEEELKAEIERDILKLRLMEENDEYFELQRDIYR